MHFQLDPGAKTYIRHLTEYFSFLYDFSKLGEEECQFLISINTIASFVFFLVGPLDAAVTPSYVLISIVLINFYHL